MSSSDLRAEDAASDVDDVGPTLIDSGVAQTFAVDRATVVQSGQSAGTEMTPALHDRWCPDVGELVGGRYRLLRPLGSGGMGAVFEAADTALEETVALKVLHAAQSGVRGARRRLRQEVRLARRVSHPNVCRVHDLGHHEDNIFVTMERLWGATLREEMQDGALRRAPFARRIDVVLQLCAGLAAAHRAGVVHRDVKPDNVIVEPDRVVLTDFGIADLAATTRTSGFAGTLSYVAPEVLRGEPQDARVDVFSVAVMAYELLAGRRPYARESIGQALIALESNPEIPALPVEATPIGVREAVTAVLWRALAIDRLVRTPSVDGFARELADAARGALIGHAETPSTGTPRAISGDETPQWYRSGVSSGVALSPGQTGSGAFGARPDTRERRRRVATVVTFRPLEPLDGASSTTVGGEWSRGGLTEQLERIVLDLGGTLLDVTRSGLVALFGAPVALGDDVVRATRAALALLEECPGRAGIDTARILIQRGADGSLGAAGDAIERSRDLARSAPAGHLLGSASSARHLVGRFATEVAGRVESERRIVRIVGPAEDEGEVARRAPLIGRERELAQLEAMIFQVCASRSPAHATVIATRGFGKSRLRLELMQRIRERRDIEWLVARATPLGEVAPLSLLQSASPAWFRAVARAFARSHAGAVTAARHWLESRAARRPVVLVLEDLHWADDASLSVVLDLLQSLDRLPIAVVAFARPSLDARLPEWRRRFAAAANPGIELSLGPLDEDGARALARHLAPSLDDAAIAIVAQRSGGQPYFVEELAREVQERRHLGERSNQHLPATIESVLQARLDRLPPLHRFLTQLGAVVGRVFWRAVLLELAPRLGCMLDGTKLDDALAELERRAIVFALPPDGLDDERYVFKHALVRDVAYCQLSPPRRREVHAAVAAFLEHRADRERRGADHTLVFQVAHHWDQAGDSAAATAAYRTAGERALELFAYPEAIRALSRAEELAPTLDRDLLYRLGKALHEGARSQDALATWQRALDDALRAADAPPLELARLHNSVGNALTSSGAYEEAVTAYHAGIDAVAALETSEPAVARVAASLYGSLGWLAGYRLGDNETGLALSERAVDLLRPLGDTADLAGAYSRLGANYMIAGRWQDQLHCNQRNLEIARANADAMSTVTAHVNLGVVYASLGELELSIQHTREALEGATRRGVRGTAALARSNLVGLRIDRGDARDPAVRAQLVVDLEDVIQVAEKVGNVGFLCETCCFMARLRALDGKLELAADFAREAATRADRQGSAPEIAVAHRFLAAVYALDDRCDEALGLLERALGVLEAVDTFEAARTRAVLARVHARNGASEETVETHRRAARATLDALGAAYDLSRLDDPSALEELR